MEKVYLCGTHRCREPSQTLDIIRPLLPGYGITRLADVTGLDNLGIPVVMASRPLAATLTVAQGKGVTRDAAFASAAMEAIEHWHGESAVPRAECRVPSADLRLGYSITDLTDLPGSLVTERTVLEWIPGRTVSGGPALVPRDLVRMGRTAAAEWRYHMLTANSNGLAAGNSRDEAIAHALHELMERDACAAIGALAPGDMTYLDLNTIPAYCADLVDRIRAGGGDLHVIAVPSRFAVPCFMTYLRVGDVSWLAGGAGAHSDPAVALSRALTEACQSRLTMIAGSRDDLSPMLYRALPEPPPPLHPEAGTGWAEAVAGLGWACSTDTEEAREAAMRVTETTGAEPIVVDLSSHPDFAVVKVLAPRLRFDARHQTPRPGAEAA